MVSRSQPGAPGPCFNDLSTPFMCHPTGIHQAFHRGCSLQAVATSARGAPSPRAPPPAGGFLNICPRRYQKVAAARVLWSPAARWWSLNKPPADLTPNILRSLRAAHRNLQTSPGNRRATVPSSHPPAPPGSTQGDGSQSKLSVLGVCPKYEPARTDRRWKRQPRGKEGEAASLAAPAKSRAW